MSSSKLAIGAIGIYTAYLTISIINEKIYTHRYQSSLASDKSQGDLFEYADLPTAISALFCFIFAFSSSIIKKQGPSPIPIKETLILGILYTINVSTLNFALYYIPYPVKVVGDKLGYLTAVVVGVFFTRVARNSKFKLGTQKIVIAIMITIGTLIFASFNKVKKDHLQLYDPSQMWKGYLLLGISVTAQAFFSDSQAFVKLTNKPTINQLIYSVNFITAIISFGRLFFNRQFRPAIQFCMTHHQIDRDILISSLLTIVGQLSIYYIVLNFKQHMFPLISTSRKVLTVLLSIYTFNHHLNIYQIIALVLVFGGMTYELIDQMYYDLTGQQKIKVLKDKKQ